MLFNYDSLAQMPLVVVGVTVLSIFAYTSYNIFTTNNSESLVNTNSSLDSIGLQATNINKDPIIQLDGQTPTDNLQYVDIGVQTEATKSMWTTIKEWFKSAFSVRSSEMTSLGENNVNNWRNNLDSIQSVDIPNSESTLTTLEFGVKSEVTLDNLVGPYDSASNVSDVISEANLLDFTWYSISDVTTLNTYMAQPDARFSHLIIDGVQQYFIIVGNAILSIDPNIVMNNLFF